jgi:hypothetical protein
MEMTSTTDLLPSLANRDPLESVHLDWLMEKYAAFWIY